MNQSTRIRAVVFDRYWSERYYRNGMRLAAGVKVKDEVHTALLRSMDLKEFEGKRVLEIGCGDSTFIPQFKNVDYTGIDISPLAVELSQRNSSDRLLSEQYSISNSYNFVLGDITDKLPFDKNSFDFVFGIQVFHLMGDKLIGALKEAVRVLRPGCKIQFDLFHTESQKFVNKKAEFPEKELSFGTLFRCENGIVSISSDAAKISHVLQTSNLQILEVKEWTYEEARRCLVEAFGDNFAVDPTYASVRRDHLKFFLTAKAMKRE